MSLKSNIEMVKDELNSEEKFFEKAVITEKFVKKYKNIIIGSVVAVVVVIVTNIVYESNKESNILAANETFTKLSMDSSDSQALLELKSLSPSLHDAWIFSKAIADKDIVTLKELKNSKAVLVSDLVAYELAKDADTLDSYASKQDSIYRDLALVQGAVLLMNEGKIDLAHQKLVKVSEQSSLSKIAKALLHYGVK